MHPGRGHVHYGGRGDVARAVEEKADGSDHQAKLDARSGCGHDQVQQAQSGEGGQQHRLAPKSVGDNSHHRLGDHPHQVQQHDVKAQREGGVPQILREVDRQKGQNADPAHTHQAAGDHDGDDAPLPQHSLDAAEV